MKKREWQIVMIGIGSFVYSIIISAFKEGDIFEKVLKNEFTNVEVWGRSTIKYDKNNQLMNIIKIDLLD